MSKPQKVWISRCMPGGTEDQLPYCQKDGIIAIGWNSVDLSRGDWETSDECKDLRNDARGGHAIRNLREFCKMQKGDWVVVPRGPELHIAQITGDKVANAEKAWAGGRVSYYEADWLTEHWRRDGFAAQDKIMRKLGQRGVTHDLLHENRQEFKNLYRPTSA